MVSKSTCAAGNDRIPGVARYEILPAHVDISGDLIRVIGLGSGLLGIGIVKGILAGRGPVSVRVKARCPRCPVADFCDFCQQEIQRALRRLRGSRAGLLLVVPSALSTTAECQTVGDAVASLLTDLAVYQALWLGPQSLQECVRNPGLRLLSVGEVTAPRWAGQTSARHRPRTSPATVRSGRRPNKRQ